MIVLRTLNVQHSAKGKEASDITVLLLFLTGMGYFFFTGIAQRKVVFCVNFFNIRDF